jgi:hypothetical protein
MTRSIVLIAVALATMGLAPALLAQDGEPLPLPVTRQAPASSQKSAPLVVRSDSLELPGLTACHQCEWRPKPHEQAAAEQCGTAPDGKARIAEFECGFSQECDRVCNFIRCLSQ